MPVSRVSVSGVFLRCYGSEVLDLLSQDFVESSSFPVFRCFKFNEFCSSTIVKSSSKSWFSWPHRLILLCHCLFGTLPFRMSLLASHNYNTPTAGRRGATLSATYLGGHLTFTSNHRHADMRTCRQTDRQAGRQAGRQTDRQTDRQNSNLVSSPSHYAIVI